MSDSPDRALEVLADVLEAPEEQRELVLERACGGEVELCAEVRRLLGLGRGASEFLEALDLARGGGRAATQPKSFGRYSIVRLIAEGGMGSVYEAEQDEPRRRVALKVIKLGMDTRKVIARFEAEREALGMMDHPNIATVHDAGVSDAGRPYFVMELVNGAPITEYCEREKLPLRQRLELFISVCRAVQHAHQKGVIHRDLKPSNVLVELSDGKPSPKVIDFGIAKATAGLRLTDKTLVTECRELIGTPAYMSPEQADPDGIGVDTRSDVYSLGVLLYELVTGETPFDARHRSGSTPEQVRRVIRESDPPRPSTRLSAQHMASPVGDRRAGLAKAVRGELDWIVMKCLEKDRTRRYETANELAADLERYLRNEAVIAGPPTSGYRVRKFMRRNRAPLAASAAMAVLLLGGVAGTTAGMLRARAAEAQARQEMKQATSLSDFFMDMFEAATPDEHGGGRDAKVADLLDGVKESLPERFHGQPEAEIRARCTIGRAYGQLDLIDSAIESFEVARQTASQHFGEGHELTLEMDGWLAHWMVEGKPARLQEGAQMALRTYEAARRKLGPTHKVTFLASKVHGWALFQQGRDDEAAAVFRRMVQEQRGSSDANGIVADSAVFHSLAWALSRQGKLREAEDAQRQAVSRLGRSPHSHAILHRNLGYILANRMKFDEAANICRKGLEVENRLGHAHFVIENLSEDYLDVLVRLERFDTAIEFARQRLNRTVADHPTDPERVKRRTEHLMAVLCLAGRRGEAAQLRGDYHTALRRRIEQPATTHLAVQRGALARMELEEFRHAAEDLERCVALPDSPADAWVLRGALLAYLQDRVTYESHCKRMLDRYGQTKSRFNADRTARIFLLVPRSADECARIAPLADYIYEGEADRYVCWSQFARGLFHYRCGQFDAAIEWLTRVRDDPPPSPATVATVELLLAMSHQKRGNATEAAAAFDRANETMANLAGPATSEILPRGPENWLICQVIHREAKSLLSGGK